MMLVASTCLGDRGLDTFVLILKQLLQQPPQQVPWLAQLLPVLSWLLAAPLGLTAP